jgi:alpha-tubulin suppressor-like RCC1 family protein
LGDGTTTNSTTPVTVTGLSGVKAIAAGEAHTVFLLEDGTVKAVGYNYSGQLGDGTTTDSTTPVDVIGL